VSDPASLQSPETATNPEPGTRYLDRYILQRPIGAGGMGQVYRALDTRLERTVAIKLLPHNVAEDTAWRRRFLNEARSASALNHPNIVSMYDICTDHNVDFLVMEFIDGQTLKDLIATKPLDLNQLASLGSQVALALGAAHAAGIVHRDIKPANIMVTTSQQVKVLDFGIARLTNPDSHPGTDETRLTNGGQILGTAAYMSPEQTRGEDTTFRSDIFSLGCVLYESAVGQPPFHAPTPLAVMHQIATVHPEPPSLLRPDLKPEFVRLVMRCLTKDPSQRPDSAVELATELRSLTYTTRPEAPISSERPSVAVLPLKIRGPATDQFLSVSLAEALIHRLSSSGKLTVRPIASVMRFTDDTDPSRVARELNVDLVIEGTVQIMSGKIRVLVGVHRSADASTIASLKQDGDSDDLFALQDRLADIVANVFDPKQTPTSETRIAPTKNPAAYELYLRAVDRQVHVDKFEMASAIDLLLRATELDPTFADAWGLLAQACAQMGSHLDSDPKWFELGERAIARTLELDPIQCTALCARSMILWSPSRSFQNRAALRALNAAIKVDPARPTARHQRSAILWHLGFLDDAEQDAKVVQQTSPALGLMHQGAIAMQRGHFDLSSDFYSRALALEPNGVLNHLMAPISILFAGHLDAARISIDKARHMFPSDSFSLGLESILTAIEGDHHHAETLADEAANSTRSMTHTHHTWHSCAATYALCGRPEKAIHELERCAALGLPSYRLFQADPYLRPLANNPTFNTLMSTLRRDHDNIREEFGLNA
jgi:TolB-like protein/Flp pilus assembly protein TadD